MRLITTAPGDAWGPQPPHSDHRSDRNQAPSIAPHNLPAADHARALRRVLEKLLSVFAVVFLGYYAYVQAETFLYQRYEERELDAILSSRPEVLTSAPSPTVPQVRPAAGSTIGRVEIPRLGVSAVVRAGSDARTLRLAVGHISGTALPGEQGNVGLAGHRDTFFRRLRDVRTDDEIRVTTAEGTFSYRVERMHVVNPRDVWVLDPTDEPVLTLVTCYPFSFVGSAPQRFIVRAELQSGNRVAAPALTFDQ